MERNLKLPESTYRALEAAAQAEGVTPAEWLRTHLPQATQGNGVVKAEESDAESWLEECLVDVPHAVGTNNRQIDADLARAYGSRARSPSNRLGLSAVEAETEISRLETLDPHAKLMHGQNVALEQSKLRAAT